MPLSNLNFIIFFSENLCSSFLFPFYTLPRRHLLALKPLKGQMEIKFVHRHFLFFSKRHLPKVFFCRLAAALELMHRPMGFRISADFNQVC